MQLLYENQQHCFAYILPHFYLKTQMRARSQSHMPLAHLIPPATPASPASQEWGISAASQAPVRFNHRLLLPLSTRLALSSPMLCQSHNKK